MRSKPVIDTRQGILRLPKHGDVKEICHFQIENKAHLSLWEPKQKEEYYTEAHWKKRVRAIIDDFVEGRSCNFLFFDKETQKLIGMVNYNNIIRGAFQACFLGFKLAENMQGEGLMTEALQASIPYMFEEWNLHRISANYMPRNKASARVLEKCGFVQEGVADDYLYINGNWERHILTSRINPQWKSENA